MRIDLEDLYRANPKVFMAAAGLIVAAFIFLVVEGVSSSSSNTSAKSNPPARGTAQTTPTGGSGTVAANGVTIPSSSYHPSYASNVPSSALDQQIASKMGASGSGTAALEGVTPAAPAWTTAYPAVPASARKNEQSYATAFVSELLDRKYRNQSRSDLERWVSAENAGLVLPGVVPQAGDHLLYAELFEPTVIGNASSSTPVPTASQWASLAASGETQRVYNVFAKPDANWSEVESKGLTSADPLLGVEDVEGVLATTVRGKTTTKNFSLQLMVASALHHPGYGATDIEQWGAR